MLWAGKSFKMAIHWHAESEQHFYKKKSIIWIKIDLKNSPNESVKEKTPKYCINHTFIKL